MTDFRREYDLARARVEAYLEGCFLFPAPQKRLLDAMRYSLLAGGKRIRPVLTIKFCEAVGGDPEQALPLGCAVEMVHTYSLIHDDLPCMDDDVLRRGKPTCHVAFDECTATLAGDALQAAAFRTVLSAPLPADRLVLAGRILAEACGEEGMCAGQVLDMEGETRRFTLPEVEQVHRYKTAAMISGACRMGVAAGGGSEEQMQAADRYAQAVGLAFQIRDDVLDVTSTAEEMGKSVHTDAENGKSTFAGLLGLDRCEEIIREQTAAAAEAADAFRNGGFLRWLAEELAGRTH